MDIVELSGKMVSKSLRLDSGVVDELVLEAEKKNTSFTGLLQGIINQYLEFLRYNHDRNFINMGNNTLKALLDCTDEDELYRCGFAMGEENPVARVFRAGLRPGRESLLAYLRTLDVYANWFTCELKDIDDVEYVYVTHNHGERWWRFLSGYFMGVFKRMELFGEIKEYKSCFLIRVK